MLTYVNAACKLTLPVNRGAATWSRHGIIQRTL
jgi:hypothetical protein